MTAITCDLRQASLHDTSDISNCFRFKDPASAITHFIGFVYSIILTPVLLIHASRRGGTTGDLIALAVFMAGMVLFYGASAAYHSFIVGRRMEMALKRIDHLMIFVQIAGSYTPFCLCVLGHSAFAHKGVVLLCVVWALAAAGMIFKLFWVTCPKWVSSVIYIGLGWSALFAIKPLYTVLPGPGFFLLVAGGVVYTVGGVIYAMKCKRINSRHPAFGSHEIFHVCVMVGSLMHYLALYLYSV